MLPTNCEDRLAPIIVTSVLMTGCGKKEEPTPAAPAVDAPKAVEPAKPVEAAAPA